MEPDKYQQAWQADAAQTRVTIDADLLRNAVQHNQQVMRAAISFGDISGIGVPLLMLPVWIYMGIASASPWTWYLMVPVYFWLIGFTLVVRPCRKQTPNDPGEPLLSSVKESLALVEHQVWLYRNILWWYLLPTAIPLLTYTVHLSWLKSRDWLDALSDVNTFMFVFLLALFYFVYYLNQRVLRTQSEPRRQELLTLLTNLSDETTSEVSGEYPILMSAKRDQCSRRRTLVASLCFLAIMSIGIAVMILVFRHTLASRADLASKHDLASGADHPEKSPFAAVRWQEDQPEVRLGEEWFKLVSLDELPASEIVAFSRETYPNKWKKQFEWQKRFEEDLVELLTRMGHPPENTVTLVVQSLTSSEPRTLEDVPMTYANRQAIWEAAQGR